MFVTKVVVGTVDVVYVTSVTSKTKTVVGEMGHKSVSNSKVINDGVYSVKKKEKKGNFTITV